MIKVHFMQSSEITLTLSSNLLHHSHIACNMSERPKLVWDCGHFPNFSQVQQYFGYTRLPLVSRCVISKPQLHSRQQNAKNCSVGAQLHYGICSTGTELEESTGNPDAQLTMSNREAPLSMTYSWAVVSYVISTLYASILSRLLEFQMWLATGFATPHFVIQ